MYKRVKTSLTNGCRVTELLLEHYGPDRVRQVEQRSENVFYAVLKEGTIIQAVVQANGTVSLQELEEAG